MQAKFTAHILQRMQENQDILRASFQKPQSMAVARHFVLDNLLPEDWALELYADFPQKKKMQTIQHMGECRLRCSALKNTSDKIKAINAAIQDLSIVALIGDITGVQALRPDPSALAGGISSLFKGHFINPHLDNSHDLDNTCYRSFNVLYYLSPNWKLEYGGHYEIWDAKVRGRLQVPSFFNRLVVMETTPTSWHSVSKVTHEEPRCCVFNYYFSEHSPTGLPYFHKTAFMARPEQPFYRAIHKVKNLWR